MTLGKMARLVVVREGHLQVLLSQQWSTCLRRFVGAPEMSQKCDEPGESGGGSGVHETQKNNIFEPLRARVPSRVAILILCQTSAELHNIAQRLMSLQVSPGILGSFFCQCTSNARSLQWEAAFLPSSVWVKK